MHRRLGCLSIPSFSMQIFLFEHPEWKDEPVVLLDRDDPRGRILEVSRDAADLGLGPGLMYGPCLGIHRNLKAGVTDDGRLEDWKRRIEEILFRFSPSVEAASFRDGLWWLDGRGLGGLFPGVRAWMEGMLEAVGNLGFDCRAAAGSGRFSTWAAARDASSGEVRIFSDPAAEEAWFRQVPVALLSRNQDTRTLLGRLKISTAGDLMKIPSSEIRRRLDGDTADMVRLLHQDSSLPLQSLEPPRPAEWRFPLEEPTDTAGTLCYAAGRLIARCVDRARRDALQVRSVRFILEGRDSSRELVLRPARPTRDKGLLCRLFSSRLEYLDTREAVRNIRAAGSFVRASTPQGVLLGEESLRSREDAEKALAVFQAERGPSAVQYAGILEDPLPTRRFELRDWSGFPGGLKVSGRKKRSPGSGMPVSVRRVLLHPESASGSVRILSRVAYSGGWWDRPYSFELAWGESAGRTCWLSSGTLRGSWKIEGWLE